MAERPLILELLALLDRVWVLVDERDEARAEVDRLREELSAIGEALHLSPSDWNDGATWLLPAEPGPVECHSIAGAVREFVRIGDVSARRDELEVERLRGRITDVGAPHLLRDQARACRLDGSRSLARRLLVLADEVAAILEQQQVADSRAALAESGQ